MRSLLIAIKILMAVVGAFLMFAAIAVDHESLIAGALVFGVGVFILVFGLGFPMRPKYPITYFRQWDSDLGVGRDPINPLVDRVDTYVKLVPAPKQRVWKVIQVDRTSGGDGGRSEVEIAQTPLK